MKSDATIQFSKRLEEACYNNPAIPEPGKGRQVVLADKLNVSQEAVRKYFSADSRPKPSTMEALAKILNVDEAWLALGHKPTVTSKEKKIYNKHATGATYYVFGLFTMNGYACSFNDNSADGADFFAIRSGINLSISTATLRTEGDCKVLSLKRSYKDNVNIMVVMKDKTSVDTYVIDSEMVSTHGDVKGGYVNVTITDESGVLLLGGNELVTLEESNLM